MKTLILTVGIPRAGKDTWAKSTGIPIVNTDNIRLCLHGTAFYAPAEPMVWAIAHVMVEALLESHDTVILSSCAVSERRRNEWNSAKWTTKYKLFDTSVAVCKERALANGQEYLLKVIDRMAKELSWPTKNVLTIEEEKELISRIL